MAMARKLPLLTQENRAFWQGGAKGELRICRCGACGEWIHPPTPICLKCDSLDLAPQAVSGRGSVASFTINYQKWAAELEVPFVIAIVELVEQPGLRFLTNIVGCPPGAVTIGMPVHVVFEQHEDVWLPLFAPDTAGRDA
jgi:uncharacterized OB-fold protein